MPNYPGSLIISPREMTRPTEPASPPRRPCINIPVLDVFIFCFFRCSFLGIAPDTVRRNFWKETLERWLKRAQSVYPYLPFPLL